MNEWSGKQYDQEEGRYLLTVRISEQLRGGLQHISDLNINNSEMIAYVIIQMSTMREKHRNVY